MNNESFSIGVYCKVFIVALNGVEDLQNILHLISSSY